MKMSQCTWDQRGTIQTLQSIVYTYNDSLKKLEFQLALQTSSSQVLLALGKSYFTFIVIKLAAKALTYRVNENEK